MQAPLLGCRLVAVGVQAHAARAAGAVHERPGYMHMCMCRCSFAHAVKPDDYSHSKYSHGEYSARSEARVERQRRPPPSAALAALAAPQHCREAHELHARVRGLARVVITR